MKLSDVIEAGASLMKGRGPYQPHQDCWAAIALGLNDLYPGKNHTAQDLYVNNPWGIKVGSDLEHYLRLVCVARRTWGEVVAHLRAYGQ